MLLYVMIYLNATKTKNKNFISLNLMYEKIQRLIFFTSYFRFNSIMKRLKMFDKFHNLIYFDIYHMLRCKNRINVKN